MTDPRVAPVNGRDRAPRAGELCECGRPAVIVYVTERFGEVPYCGIPDGAGRRRECDGVSCSPGGDAAGGCGCGEDEG